MFMVARSANSPTLNKAILKRLHAQEVLARFTHWKKFAPPILNWLWIQHNSQGLWDRGGANPRSVVFPSSDSWRKPANRMIDWSVRILKLLSSYFQGTSFSITKN